MDEDRLLPVDRRAARRALRPDRHHSDVVAKIGNARCRRAPNVPAVLVRQPDRAQHPFNLRFDELRDRRQHVLEWRAGENQFQNVEQRLSRKRCAAALRWLGLRRGLRTRYRGLIHWRLVPTSSAFNNFPPQDHHIHGRPAFGEASIRSHRTQLRFAKLTSTNHVKRPRRAGEYVGSTNDLVAQFEVGGTENPMSKRERWENGRYSRAAVAARARPKPI